MNGLSNFDLQNIAQRQKIPLDGVISKDRLKERFRPKPSQEFNLIINLQDLYDGEGDLQPGTHWVSLCFFKKENKYTYFDSYGFPPPVDVVQFCKKHHPSAEIVYTNSQIQQLNTVWCGVYALLFIDYMRTYPKTPLRKRYDNFMGEFHEDQRGKNDQRLLKMVRRYF